MGNVPKVNIYFLAIYFRDLLGIWLLCHPFTKWFICEYTTTLIKSLKRRSSRESYGNSHLMGRVSELILFNAKTYLRFSR